jgi:hypothetical protein
MLFTFYGYECYECFSHFMGMNVIHILCNFGIEIYYKNFTSFLWFWNGDLLQGISLNLI